MQMCQKWCLPAFYDLMSVLGHGLLSESGCKHEGVLAEVEGRPMQLITEAIASAIVTALPSDLCTCQSKQGQENCDYRHVFRTCLEATSSALTATKTLQQGYYQNLSWLQYVEIQTD